MLSEAQLRAARSDCAKLVLDGTFADTDQHDASVRSDQICWISEDGRHGAYSDSWLASLMKVSQREGLVAVLRLVRSLAAEVELHGESGHGAANALGVPRSGQLARYTAASRAVTADDLRPEQVARNSFADLVVPADDQRAPPTTSRAVIDATGGARYSAHRDGVPLRSASLGLLLSNPGIVMRSLTAIVYLSEWPHPNLSEWPAAVAATGAGEGRGGGRSPPLYRIVDDVSTLQAGALVLYLGADAADASGVTARQVVEVLPVGGRLVLFDARTVLHEVRPNTRPELERLAMTVWLGGAHDVASLGRLLCDLLHAWGVTRDR